MDHGRQVLMISPYVLHHPQLYLMEFLIFKRVIICDITLYLLLKYNRQYHNWYCNTHAIDSVHGAQAVFDPIIALQKLLKLYYGKKLNDLSFQ